MILDKQQIKLRLEDITNGINTIVINTEHIKPVNRFALSVEVLETISNIKQSMGKDYDTTVFYKAIDSILTAKKMSNKDLKEFFKCSKKITDKEIYLSEKLEMLLMGFDLKNFQNSNDLLNAKIDSFSNCIYDYFQSEIKYKELIKKLNDVLKWQTIKKV